MTQTTGCLDFVLLGRTGAGKSASGNKILGREAFTSKKSPRSVTRDVTMGSATVDGFPVTVYDTPGLFEAELREHEIQQMINEKVLQKCNSDRCVFLLVIKADRFTEEERRTVEKIEKLLGEERLKKTWILFTGEDQLVEENTTIKEFINLSEPLKQLVQKYEQRYHVFNNKNRGPNGQVKMLLTKILRTCSKTMGKLMEKVSQIPKNVKPDTDSPSSRRIVLLGKSGVGKSAAGNTILGQREFISVQRMNSVTSKCSEAHATVSGRSVSVVDTPGFFDTEMKTEELMMEIARSLYISSPGPHAFLIVFPVNNRFTEQEQQITEQIKTLFGEEVLKYSIILFTHGDLLEGESVEELIEENCRLRDVVDQCGGRFHVFNNKYVNNRDQVNDLLQKIDTMIEQNGGGHYSNQMYEDAQRFRREEEEKRQREEKQRREEIERVRKETEEKIRAEFEGPPRFLQERLKSIRLRKEDRKRQVEELEELKRGFSQLHSSRTHMRMPMGMRRRRGEEKKQREKQQLQEEIERVIKETEKEIRAEFEGSPRFLLERLMLRLRDEQERKSQEEKQVQEEIERVRKETEEEIVTELLEGFKSMRLREEEGRKQREEEQRREEIERVRKETEEKIRAEFDGPPRFLQERLTAMRLRVEERIRHVEEQLFGELFYHTHAWIKMEERIDYFMEICRAEYKQEEIKSVIKETEEKIRAEFNKL